MAHLAKQSVQILKSEYNFLKSERAALDTVFDELRRTVMPNAGDFFNHDSPGIEEVPDDMYDSLPSWAAEQLANGIFSNLTPDDDRWMRLVPVHTPYQDLHRRHKIYLQDVMDTLYHHWSLPDSGFYTGLYEADREAVVFGTGVLFQERNLEDRTLRHTPFPLGSCFVKQNASGRVDTMYRRFKWSLRRIIQEWGEDALPRTLKEKLQNTIKKEEALTVEYEVVHTVKPRKDVNFPVRGVSTIKPFYSFYWLPSEDATVHEGTFDIFPYNVGRWTKMPGHTYGRSPGIVALADIRLLNAMNRDLISYSQMNLFTPLVMEEDGFLPPIEYVPGATILKTPGVEDPKQLPVGGRFEITLEMMDQKREQITRAFYMDFLLRQQKKARQTTFEVSDERQQMLQQLGPIFGQWKKDFVTPLVQGSFFHLTDMGVLPEPPADFKDVKLKVSYQGAAAKAQLAVKADNNTRYIQDMVPLLQIDPKIIRKVDFNALADVHADYRDVDPRILKSDDQVEKEIAEEQAQQQAITQTQIASEAAGAAKDVASAQQILSQT